ncbi:uncharacterized protein LOC124299206 [Neodiprion virginianus]|uniref:uncharacterized protein LOC124299206 n=1 Tax=Neodiprion virginianus TaxID=2961670 RepID=UPI001EE6E91F|nr:uncharacterized protein LOC124299206 [Neodiprion virginianus]
MKLTIVFLAILGVSTAAVLPAAKTFDRSTRSLSDDWAELKELVPWDEIVEIVTQYVAEDAEVQSVIAYLHSDDFKALAEAVISNSEYIAFLDYLDAAGLDIYTYVNIWRNWLGINTSRVLRTRFASSRITGGVAGLINDIIAILPIDEIKALYYNKLETSEDFAKLIAHLGSDEAQELYAALKANEEYQHIREALVAYGLDIDSFVDLLKSIVGLADKMKLSILFLAFVGVATAASLPAPKVLNRSTRDLSDDFQDFLALIPVDDVVAIVIEYLAEDEEVQNAVEYIQSDDFANLILAVDAIPEYIAFLDYLNSAGLDVYTYVNLLHSWLGLDELEVPSTRLVSSRITGGIAGLFADIIAVLPVDEIKALYYEKLESSTDFASLVTLLGSEEAQTVYAALKANEEYQHIRETLEEYGLDIDAIVEFLKTIVGLA